MIRLKRNGIFFIALLLMLATTKPVAAQGSPEKVKALLLKVQNAYRQAPFLGFQVKYKYANQDQPGKYIDSLSGEVSMDKDRFHFVIDGTETLVTDKYALYVVQEDKVIYLSAAKHKGMMDPVGLLDTMLAHLEGIKADITTVDHSQILTMSFPPGQLYAAIKMRVNTQTGWIENIQYNLHTNSLVGEEMIDRPGHPGRYQQEGKIEMSFSGYRLHGFGNALFDETRFITRAGNSFEPVGKYKDYHIFLATPNL